jgi:hypothetical protein
MAEQEVGQAPAVDNPPAGQAPVAQPGAQDAPTEDKEVAKLRAEAAKWRTQFRETQEALQKVQAEAGENKKVADQLTAIQAQLEKAQAEAEAAQKMATLTRYAVKAGVDPDVAALLDLSKIDLSDEKKALEVLSKLKGSAAAGTQAKPGGTSAEDMRAQMFAPRKSSIFGG